ncbi:UNVERIFIED_CONTAM: hypothetical protein Slati_1891800 [Sesamum latifolium]|uniref:Uncharacterized protein n=1 Tax=Sesamum latifolium TaxID=2727402 RepID=A0AAW2X175_9LAMI
MASNKPNYVLVLYMLFLLLQQHLGLFTSAYRAPPPVPASVKLHHQRATVGFRFNRYKKIQADAFRPTAPGHSPGMGHNDPPGRAVVDKH